MNKNKQLQADKKQTKRKHAAEVARYEKRIKAFSQECDSSSLLELSTSGKSG